MNSKEKPENCLIFSGRAGSGKTTLYNTCIVADFMKKNKDIAEKIRNGGNLDDKEEAELNKLNLSLARVGKGATTKDFNIHKIYFGENKEKGVTLIDFQGSEFVSDEFFNNRMIEVIKGNPKYKNFLIDSYVKKTPKKVVPLCLFFVVNANSNEKEFGEIVRGLKEIQDKGNVAATSHIIIMKSALLDKEKRDSIRSRFCGVKGKVFFFNSVDFDQWEEDCVELIKNGSSQTVELFNQDMKYIFNTIEASFSHAKQLFEQEKVEKVKKRSEILHVVEKTKKRLQTGTTSITPKDWILSMIGIIIIVFLIKLVLKN